MWFLLPLKTDWIVEIPSNRIIEHTYNTTSQLSTYLRYRSLCACVFIVYDANHETGIVSRQCNSIRCSVLSREAILHSLKCLLQRQNCNTKLVDWWALETLVIAYWRRSNETLSFMGLVCLSNFVNNIETDINFLNYRTMSEVNVNKYFQLLKTEFPFVVHSFFKELVINIFYYYMVNGSLPLKNRIE